MSGHQWTVLLQGPERVSALRAHEGLGTPRENPDDGAMRSAGDKFKELTKTAWYLAPTKKIKNGFREEMTVPYRERMSRPCKEVGRI